MPVIIPFIPALIAAAAAAAGTSAIVATALMIAASLIVGAITKSSRSMNGFAAEAQGRSQVVRSNVQPRNLIYGRAMTSGPLIFAASTDGPSKANQYMHLIIALADHECDAIEEVYLGDDPVGNLDEFGQPTAGRFLKTWGESTTKEFPITPGAHTDYTFDLDATIWRVTSAIATWPVTENEGYAHTFANQSLRFAYTDGGHTVNVYGIDPMATSVVVFFEAKAWHRYVRVNKHLGHVDQQADNDLVAEVPGWTSAHRLRGVCYVYVRLEYDSDIFPNGLPNIKALVRGKRLWDPRSGVTAWSNNWALCVYDYLRDERGFGCADSDIDFQTIVTAANISDEWLDLGNGIFQSRYRCDGVVMTDKSPRDNLSEMVTASGGVISITGGVFRTFAGAYDIPAVTLTESDLRGAIKVRPRTSRKDLFNVVKGTFINPNNAWQPSDFPAVRNPTYASFDGETIERDIELPYTTDSVMAQRLAKIILERSRQSIVVEFPAKLTAFQLTAYSTVYLSLAKFGWVNKVFRVMSWKMSAAGGVDLVLNEEAAAVYSWNYGDATVTDPAPDTNLPDPFSVENVGQVFIDSGEQHLIVTDSGVVVSRAYVTWPAPREQSLEQLGRVELQYRRWDTDWMALATMAADTTSVYISPVEDGIAYQVRARFVSSLGVRSPDWSYSPAHVIVGKLAPPANLTGLSLTVLNGFANLTWDPATDLDVRNGGQARIRHTTDLVQPTWGSAIDIGGFVSGAANSVQLPLLSGVYLAKWIDSTGHESPGAAMVITTAPSLVDLNIVATVMEHPTFVGAKTNVVLDTSLNGIKLIGLGMIDDQDVSDPSGLWDTQPSIDTLGAIDDVVGQGGWGLIDSWGGIVDSGSYAFASSLDLGVVEKSRLTATISSVAFDTGDMIDDKFDMIDSWEDIDGARINDTSVTLYVRTTNDDPAGTPAWTEWHRFSMGDYEARAFQWKVELTSASANHNVVVTGLTVSVDMPDRIDFGRGVVSAAGPTAVTFDKPFRIVPAIGITAQNMQQGDWFTVNPPTTAGFTVNFFNSAGTPISRRFDWDAKGY
ncbi:phage tail protein [Cupriavidus sp.]|uniref:phage tail protein n=1 Tax=Cupriavidus sp. TaxID=1873897 RepID=UPI0028BDDB6E|nr:phage tail protein [Cupriavidus sp.]